jgi:hypothetical protein
MFPDDLSQRLRDAQHRLDTTDLPSDSRSALLLICAMLEEALARQATERTRQA